MSLIARAEAFLHAAAVNRGEAVSLPPADALADLIVAYEERMAMVLEGGDISDAEAHRIATAECGDRLDELRARLTEPHQEAWREEQHDRLGEKERQFRRLRAYKEGSRSPEAHARSKGRSAPVA